MQEVVKLAELSEVVESTTGISEQVADESNKISHNDLKDRNTTGQHVIEAIAGLREELNDIESLHDSNNSKNRRVAQYYAWIGDTPPSEDPVGTFVSLVEKTHTIKLCTSKKEDVLGVIVSESDVGFIGGKFSAMLKREITANDKQYGLVCNSGEVKVQRESDVQVGDYVVPNALGMAKKSVADKPIRKSYFDTIEITAGNDTYSLTYEPIATPKVYLVDDDGSLGTAVSVVDNASGKDVAIDRAKVTVDITDGGYATGDKLCFMYEYESNGGVGYKVNAVSEALGVKYAFIDLSSSGSMLTRLQDEVNDLNSRVEVIEANVVTAINKANEAYDKVDNATSGGTGGGSNTGGETNDGSGTGGGGGDTVIDSALEQRIETLEAKANDLDEEMSKAMENIDANTTNIEKNDELIQTLANVVHECAVGEYSQANGLTKAQAQKMLSVSPPTVYVPYSADKDEITEEYYVEDGSNIIKVFTKGYSYQWLGEQWSDGIENVYISDEYVVGTDGNYWLIPGNDDIETDTTYKARTLYLHKDGAWVAVARLDDNALSRVGSMITQTADSIMASVVSQDAFMTLQGQVSQNSADIRQLAGIEDGDMSSLAGMQIQADRNAASVLQLAEYGDNVVTYNQLSIKPTGTFYAKRPEWDWTTKKWVFESDSSISEMPGYTDEVNYCYAPHTDDTFYQYVCEAENQWVAIEISKAQSITAMQQQANDQGALIELVAEYKDGSGQIKAASITQAVTEDGSSIDMLADSLNLSGYVTFTSLETEGETSIHGGNIQTDTITADHITADAIDAISAKIGDIVTNTIRNEYDVSAISNEIGEGAVHSSFHMDSYDRLNATSGLDKRYFTDSEGNEINRNYMYVGTDGMGTYRINSVGSGIVTDKSQTWMANGKLYSNSIVADGGWIGTETSGFAISDKSIRNEYDVSKIGSGSIGKFYMKSHNEFSANIESNSLWDTYWYGYDNQEINRNYVYVGTDGVGTYRINSTNGTGKVTSTSQTWMADGKLYSNSAEISGRITATSGYIGNGESGFEIGSKSIYNRYTMTAQGSPPMTFVNHLISPTKLNNNSLYLMTDETSKFVYIGTDGIGTVKYTNLDNGNNTDAVELSSYMADGRLFSNSATITGHISATSGYIGDGTNGLTIGYSERSGTYALMYNQDAHNNTSNQGAVGGVYIGSDGIGLGNGRFYIDQHGNVHMRSGTIGYGTYKWNIAGEESRAYLWCGSNALASDGGLIATQTNNAYLGTNGLSLSIGNSGAADYTTVIKSGHILTYGDNSGSETNQRATRLYHNGIEFFYTGSQKISDDEFSTLSAFKVGGIEIGTDKNLNISAKQINFNGIDGSNQAYSNSMSLTFGATYHTFTTSKSLNISAGSLTFISKDTLSLNLANDIWVNGSKTLTGWIRATAFAANGTTGSNYYFHYINGMLVEVTKTAPSGTVTWLINA